MGFSAGRLVDVYKKLGQNIVGVEIGVCRGENIKALIDVCGNIKKMYGVDPWREYVIRKRNTEKLQFVLQSEVDEWRTTAYKLLDLYIQKSQVELIRNFSVEVSRGFEDSVFDFVFIDGDHSTEEVKKDLYSWWPKVKLGGVFSGHDFRPKDVEVHRAVFDFADDVKINLPVIKSGPCWYIQKPR
jgi:hypothetical protein